MKEVSALLEKDAMKYHLAVCWVAFVLNPVFAITDVHNIPNIWKPLLVFRLCASAIILMVILLRHKFHLNSLTLIMVPFLSICFENTVVYWDIDIENIQGQNLNFMALFIGASMFLVWRWYYSLIILIPSMLLTVLFLSLNHKVSLELFFVKGGLLLIFSGLLMAILIQTRYQLTVKTLTAKVLLQESNKALETQTQAVKELNENLEQMVKERTLEILKKNQALEEYTFVNSHKLRSPVANIVGLAYLLSQEKLPPAATEIVQHLLTVSQQMDQVVKDTTKKLNMTES